MIKLNSFEAAENHIAKLLVKSSKEKLKRENFNGALKDIEKAVELNDQLVACYFMKGEIYSSINRKYNKRSTKKQNYLLALKNYEKAIEMEPNNYESFQGRGNLYLMEGKYSHAKNDFTVSINLANAIETIDNLDPLETFPLDCFYLVERRGIANFKLGNIDAAREDLNKVNRIVELGYSSIFSEIYSLNKYIIYDSRGYANLKCGFFKYAIRDFSNLINIEKEMNFHSDVFLLRSEAFANDQKYELAVDDILKAIDINKKCFKNKKKFLKDFPDDFKGVLQLFLPYNYLNKLDFST